MADDFHKEPHFSNEQDSPNVVTGLRATPEDRLLTANNPERLTRMDIIGIVGVIFTAVATVAAIIVIPPVLEMIQPPCETPYLSIHSDDKVGMLVYGEQGNMPARRFRLTVGNPTNECTAVDTHIYVQVVNAFEDNHPAQEALMSKFKYKIVVTPADQDKELLVTASDEFSYKPKQSDDIEVDVTTPKRGYSFALRFLAQWRDLKTSNKYVAKSWLVLAPFPSGQGESFYLGGEKTFEWRQNTLTKLRQQYDNDVRSVEDAKVPERPYPLFGK